MRAILKRKTVEALIVQPTGALYYGMIWRYLKREMKAYRSFQSGRRGEERMLEQIRCYLDQRWTIFRNLQLPGRKSDIDLVLVGPGGVWVVEIKAYAGTIRVRDGAWERQQGGAWRPLDGDPEKQVRGNAAALNDFLQRHGINRWVESAVALAEPQPISNLEGAALPIWADFNVASQVAALATRNPPSREEQAAIVALLTRQAEQQVAVEESRQKPE